ncbi:MAG: hypothetical protein A3E37_00960 [Candidatus Andersenbacteria bacterium RIFCSPHIGHO2_12_FULL_46_9]|nr:MAG: Phage terminase, large subunit, PBSX family [Parcubacteria group bacterium GW2011_GWA2_45_14]OGY33354.1 MAG: hypothetical protein A3B76_02415 [Candidatus Andersenbacteria bacterium RIFCSPHIGHO2_02_FULL_46_16]OGY35601.1 MAG: hypothetical protein A3E37_00960 [Candidatus Andersenbacteria bacterium RIFCSPHIGHO2_12_FULL_46_9]OGY36453.1 MAG: hypothetical protein A3I08_01415 [Candidatus Andersenbacteria bacterium RIFCSPLOWO2_02_FULL_46_11]OGY38514.1 MAG: hypothetical protein A3G57_00460 [Candi
MNTKEVKLFRQQYDAIQSKAQFTVCCAGVQSGKTFTGAHWVGLKMQEFPQGTGVIVAPSYKILQQATLAKLWDVFPELHRYYKAQKEVIELPGGGQVFIRSADAPLSIEGITADYIWGDELGMASQLTWTVLRSRVSMTGGQVFITTTPYAMNWLYKEFYLPWQEGRDKNLAFYTWPSIANPAFSKEFYDNEQKRLTSEEFHRRYMGEFQKMTGLVWDLPSDLIIDPIDNIVGKATTRIMGVDFGFRNPAAIVTIAYYDRAYYVIAEWKQAERVTADILQAAYNFVKDYRVEKIYPDPEDQEKIQEMRNKFLPVYEANKSVVDGINHVRQLIHEKRLFVFKTCIQTLEEMSQYRYDEAALDREAKELPVKLNDHLMDALRYALYSFQPSDNRQPQASPAWRPSYLGDLDILSGTVESKTAVKAINNSNRFASQETGYREAVKASPIINPYQL